MALLQINTKYGAIRGVHAGNPKISVFKGIPYAKPPVGELRWRPPQEPDKWEKELLAYDYRAVPCQVPQPEWEAQNGIDSFEMSEDCLYLNVWTPAVSSQERLPVVIYIYGGAFKFGAASSPVIKGEALAEAGLVFVSFNYRLGPLGYLCHEELSAESVYSISGNYGSQDQIAAIRWVYENIAAFGGDPDNIGIMGHSAGAYSATSMCNTPHTKGIIKRALILSTAGLSALYYNERMSMKQAEDEGREFLNILGVSSIAQARQLPAMEITRKLFDIKLSGKSPWFPKIDGYIFEDDAVTSIMKGKQHKIPYLIGCTEDETGSMPGFMSSVSRHSVSNFAKAIFPEDPDGYLASVDLSTETAIYQTIFNEYANDKLCAILGWQQLEMNRKGDLAYTYFFTKDAPEAGDDHHGAYHGSELPLIFDTMTREGRPYTGSHFELSVMMRSYFANFLKTGDPNSAGLPKWRKPTVSIYEFLELGDQIGMVNIARTENRAFVVDYMIKQAEKAK